jgi:hypothetical protein
MEMFGWKSSAMQEASELLAEAICSRKEQLLAREKRVNVGARRCEEVNCKERPALEVVLACSEKGGRSIG